MVDFVSTKAKLDTATMKYIAAFLLFTVSVCHGLRLPTELGKEVKLKDDDTCPAIFSCKDCNTVRVCHPDSTGNLIILKESPCPNNRSWCEPNSGTCTNKQPATCGQKDDFICLKNNQHFPDTDCHRFHYCDDKYEAKLFQCLPNTTVFNPVKQTCEDPTVTTCGTFDCSNSDVKKATHNAFVDYYALCTTQGTNTLPLVVDVCPEMYVLNTTSQLCEPDCKRYSSMNIADYKDCHNYYHCNSIFFMPGEQFVEIVKYQCPTGLAYDSSLFACVDEGTVESCKTSSKV